MAKRLMVTRYGEIHEECPDCRGDCCTPYDLSDSLRQAWEAAIVKAAEILEKAAPLHREQCAGAYGKLIGNTHCASILDAYAEVIRELAYPGSPAPVKEKT